jgi:Clp amino terminal domain, pathogenicity island component/NTF2 fold immunity protein
MFERYTERARRVIFFARYEASQFGSVAIEPEHLLLGVLREDRNAVSRFLGPKVPAEDIRNDIASRLAVKEKVSTSVDLPLTPASKRILSYSAEEVERLRHHHIGVEHLLLGILREEGTIAAQVLDARGLKLNSAREELARNPLPEEPSAFGDRLEEFSNLYGALRNPALPKSGVIADADTAKKVAEAIWTSLYGEQTVAAQKPLQAELKFNTWIVTGSAAPESALFAFMLQADGRILSIGLGRPKP